MKTLLCFLAIFALSPSSHGQSDFSSIKDKILRPLLECSERVWPGYKPLLQGQVVLAYPSKKTSFVVKQDGSVVETPIETWGERVKVSYELTEIAGIKTSIVNMEHTADESEALGTLFHESFHYFGQSEIPVIDTEREELMPLDLQARVARSMQVRNVKAFVKEGRASGLERAKYWENWIKSNRPKEWKDNQYWDASEGGALYAEQVSLALAELGCDASEEALLAFILEDTVSEGVDLRVTQSYTAGFYGYLASRMGKLDEVFKSLSSSPVTLITSTCAEEIEEEDKSTYAKLEAKFGIYSKAVGAAKSDFEKKPHLLALPWESVQGSYSTMGFFKAEIGGNTLGIYPDTTLLVSDSNGRIELTGRDLWKSTETVCGKDPSKMMLITIEDARAMETDAKGMSGSYELVESGSLHGKKLFCPK